MQPTFVQVPPGAGRPFSFFIVDARGVETELRSADRRDLATGTAADDNDIKFFAHA